MHLLHGEKPRESWVRAMHTSLILYAEHEFNASTFTSRVIAGTGYLAFSVIFASFMMLALYGLFMIRFGKTTDHNIVLKISVPESLNYSNLFDDLLKKYCLSYNLNRVRTIDFGTMFEVTYYIVIKKSTVQKDFIDKIRERNGNMTVTLTVQRFNVES
jgi:hypothetical protein